MSAAVPGSLVGVSAWRTRLGPWLNALQAARLELPLPLLATVSDMEKLWIKAHYAPTEWGNNAATWIQLTEAFELLELLARVDQHTAWQLLFETAGRPHILETHADQLFPRDAVLLPRFVVRISTEALLEADEERTQASLRFTLADEHASTAYGGVKQVLLDSWRGQHENRMFQRESEGRVKIALELTVSKIELDDDDVPDGVFFVIQNMAYAQTDVPWVERVGFESDDDEDEGSAGEQTAGTVQDKPANHSEGANGAFEQGERHGVRGSEDGATRPRGPFEIVAFRFRVLNTPVSNMLVETLDEVAKSGMPISHMTLTNMNHEDLHSSTRSDFLVSQFVPWRGAREGLGLSSVTVDLGAFDDHAVRAFCTVIARSQSLRTFKYRGEEGYVTDLSEDVWWPWLAYSLFSAYTDHEINS